MTRTRNTLIWIWLTTTLAVTVISLVAYRSMTRVPDLAGRTDPTVIWDDPTAVFADPGLLGTAVELRVTEAVRACMAEQGQAFRGPAMAESIYTILDPAADGYGIAAGGTSPRPTVGGGGPSLENRTAYETALYGAPLDATGTTDGGCAAVGYQALIAAVDTLETMPYTIDQLEADALADPDYAAATEAWGECMTLRGYAASSPDDLIRTQVSRLATVSGDAARALAAEERRIAVDDFACRRQTIDPATRAVAERLAPVFVERNRSQLETLIPRPGGPDLPAGLGSGDVQATLIWRSKADLDLSVTDPSSDVVYYGNRNIASGGTLDRDANYPCNTDDASPAVENVFWPTDAAPDGSYTASVVLTSDCLSEGPQSFELIVRVGGVVIHDSQHTVTAQENRFDFDFTVGSK